MHSSILVLKNMNIGVTTNYSNTTNTSTKVHKVDVHNLSTHLNQTPTFEWYVGMCGTKNIYYRIIYLKVIGLHAQSMILIILNSVFNITRGIFT